MVWLFFWFFFSPRGAPLYCSPQPGTKTFPLQIRCFFPTVFTFYTLGRKGEKKKKTPRPLLLKDSFLGGAPNQFNFPKPPAPGRGGGPDKLGGRPPEAIYIPLFIGLFKVSLVYFTSFLKSDNVSGRGFSPNYKTKTPNLSIYNL